MKGSFNDLRLSPTALLLLVFLSLPGAALAQWAAVDPTFPAGDGPSDTVRALAVQDDGKVLVSGFFTSLSGVALSNLARLNPDGTVDASFAAQLDDDPRRIQPLPDGRILISGYFTKVNGVGRPGVAMLHDDGSLDETFVPPTVSGSGSLFGWAAPGGEVFVTGTFTTLGGLPRNRLARLLADGSVDPAFESPFESSTPVALVGVHSDGKPLISGSFSNVAGLPANGLVRLNPDGSVDTSFRSGLAPNERINRAVLQPDGRLVAAVATVGHYDIPVTPQRLLRFEPDGSLDPAFVATFESPGFPWTGSIYELAVQGDGKILVCGSFLRVNGTPRARVARLHPDGTLDHCFDVPFGAELFVLAVSVDSDGGVIVGGKFNGAQGVWRPNLLRLVPPDECDPGVIELAVPWLFALEDAPRVVVPVVRRGGADLEQTVLFTTRDGWARSGLDYEAVSGALHFAPGERSKSISVPLLRDALVEGVEMFEVLLTGAGNGARLGARTNSLVILGDPLRGTAGAPDTNFVVQLDGPVQHVLPMPDGRVVITGSFTNVNGQFSPNIARLLPDGSRDTGFVRTQPLEQHVWSAALDTHGRLIVAGNFQRVDGVWRPGLARFENHGSLDETFAPFDAWPTNTGGYSAEIDTVSVLADGSIVCGGWVPVDALSSRGVLLKFSPSGELQAGFTNQLPRSVTVNKLRGLPDGDLLVMGTGFGNSLVRLHESGALDVGFVPPADLQVAPYGANVEALPSRQVMVSGSATIFHGLPLQPPIWRLNPDGSRDAGFALTDTQGAPGSLERVHAFSVTADDRVVVAGRFSEGSAGLNLARLHANGSIDKSFDDGTGLQPVPNRYVSADALVPLPAGGWLVGGDFGGYDGFAQRYLVKVLPEALSRPLTFQFTRTNVTVDEATSPLAVQVSRSGDASTAASVTVRTQDGTARGGEDFVAFETQLDFAPGEWARTVIVAIIDDQLVEPIEQFTIHLADPTGGFSLGSPAETTVRIISDDIGIEFVQDEFRATEEDGYAMAAVKWSGSAAPGSQVLVNIVPVTGQPEDLGVTSVVITCGPGTTWFRIPVVDDAEAEGAETFALELVGSASVIPGPRSNATLVINDLDFPTTPARGVAGVIEAMANSPQGGVYLAGDFTGVHGVPLNRVARLRPDGEVDLNFNPGEGPNGSITALAVQPDGRVLIAGGFTAVDGTARAGMARLEEDGSLDASFDPGSGALNSDGTTVVRAILPREDGVYVAGTVTHFNGYPRRLITRLLDDGSVDESFVSPFTADPAASQPPQWSIPGITPTIHALAAQDDDTVLAGGAMYFGTSSIQAAVVRLTSGGQIDSAFATISVNALGAAARSLALTDDGKLLAGLGQPGTVWIRFLPRPLPPIYVTSAATNLMLIRCFNADGQANTSFEIRNAPPLSFKSSETRQMLVQPDGRILFCSALDTVMSSPSSTPAPGRTIIGRLMPDGAWDDEFDLVTCETAVPEQGAAPTLANPPAPAVSFVRQPDGVLVLAGAFETVNGEPRRRLARLDPDGSVRGRLNLELLGALPMRLMLPPEVEIPYLIETSTDLNHWSGWLMNGYPWWPAELWLPADESARFFRARPVEQVPMIQ